MGEPMKIILNLVFLSMLGFYSEAANANHPAAEFRGDTAVHGDLTLGGKLDFFGGQTMCLLVQDSCPKGFHFRGHTGIILQKEKLHQSPFNAGAPFNGSWTWVHPLLCCND